METTIYITEHAKLRLTERLGLTTNKQMEKALQDAITKGKRHNYGYIYNGCYWVLNAKRDTLKTVIKL